MDVGVLVDFMLPHLTILDIALNGALHADAGRICKWYYYFKLDLLNNNSFVMLIAKSYSIDRRRRMLRLEER